MPRDSLCPYSVQICLACAPLARTHPVIKILSGGPIHYTLNVISGASQFIQVHRCLLCLGPVLLIFKLAMTHQGFLARIDKRHIQVGPSAVHCRQISRKGCVWSRKEVAEHQPGTAIDGAHAYTRRRYRDNGRQCMVHDSFVRRSRQRRKASTGYIRSP
jgi:hypothetical protein